MSKIDLPDLNKRKFIFTGAALTGLAASTSSSSLASWCANKVTPQQIEGPFYPIHDQIDKDNDLTWVQGRDHAAGAALGEVIYIQGRVTDINCSPVAGALVEIWQACHTGRYDHPADPNPAELDENFQYWGQCVTDENGGYIFRTILPGSYPAGRDWMRPPHIHYKVSKLGYMELITQLYFKGNPLNDGDLILRRLPAAERNKVVVDLVSPGLAFDPNRRVANFDITIENV